MTILQETTQSDLSRVIAQALESASTSSVISTFVENQRTVSMSEFRPSVVTLWTVDEQELRVSTLTPKSASAVELVSEGAIIDPAPSGSFDLSCGKTLVIEKGRLVGGTAATGDIPRWAVFFLFPGAS